MTTIALRDIWKSFGRVPVLNGIDLEIHSGEFLTLVGPSGCGKSTLLRIIAGLENQSAGDIKIGEKIVNDIRASQRDLAMVFQSYALYPHMTVEQNITTPLLLRDLSFLERLPLVGRFVPASRSKRRGIQLDVERVAQTLKIEHLLTRKPGQLSGGQRQRVAVGRAMVRNPTAFLMDEPLSNLDAALRVHMRAELASLHRSLDTTFVYVTHDQAEALTMSDRMAVMMDGQILQLGPPDEVYKNPNDLRVAEFVGSPKMNIIPATVDADNSVSLLGKNINRSVKTNHKDIYIGVRPEHVKCYQNGQIKDGWPYKITHLENMGAELFLHGVINGCEETIVARASTDETSELNIGQHVQVEFDTSRCFAFGMDNNRLNFLDEVA